MIPDVLGDYQYEESFLPPNHLRQRRKRIDVPEITHIGSLIGYISRLNSIYLLGEDRTRKHPP
jgi:hypothetical protein